MLLGLSSPGAALASEVETTDEAASRCPVDISYAGPRNLKVGSRYNLLIVISKLSSCKLRDLALVQRLPARVRFRRASPIPAHHQEPSRLLIWDSVLKGKDSEAIEIGIEIEGKPGKARRSEVCLMSEQLDQGMYCKTFDFWIE